ncbi:MAG: hypothetical protein MUD14_10470 [Hydrococcus sp. Prado102]|nr:hypothetical protein [Hydrococcus sp. Prado102]
MSVDDKLALLWFAYTQIGRCCNKHLFDLSRELNKS